VCARARACNVNICTHNIYTHTHIHTHIHTHRAVGRQAELGHFAARTHASISRLIPSPHVQQRTQLHRSPSPISTLIRPRPSPPHGRPRQYDPIFTTRDEDAGFLLHRIRIACARLLPAAAGPTRWQRWPHSDPPPQLIDVAVVLACRAAPTSLALLPPPTLTDSYLDSAQIDRRPTTCPGTSGTSGTTSGTSGTGAAQARGRVATMHTFPPTMRVRRAAHQEGAARQAQRMYRMEIDRYRWHPIAGIHRAARCFTAAPRPASARPASARPASARPLGSQALHHIYIPSLSTSSTLSLSLSHEPDRMRYFSVRVSKSPTRPSSRATASLPAARAAPPLPVTRSRSQVRTQDRAGRRRGLQQMLQHALTRGGGSGLPSRRGCQRTHTTFVCKPLLRSTRAGNASTRKVRFLGEESREGGGRRTQEGRGWREHERTTARAHASLACQESLGERRRTARHRQS
jgi:hypothetical protein